MPLGKKKREQREKPTTAREKGEVLATFGRVRRSWSRALYGNWRIDKEAARSSCGRGRGIKWKEAVNADCPRSKRKELTRGGDEGREGSNKVLAKGVQGWTRPKVVGWRNRLRAAP